MSTTATIIILTIITAVLFRAAKYMEKQAKKH